jgi:hypothetical protein
MSAETELATLRLKERDLLDTPCVRCGHRLGSHSRIQQNCCGNPPPGVTRSLKPCKCKGFAESDDPTLFGEPGDDA